MGLTEFNSGIRAIVANHPDFFEGKRPIASCYKLEKDENTAKYVLFIFDVCGIPDDIRQEIQELYLVHMDGSLQ